MIATYVPSYSSFEKAGDFTFYWVNENPAGLIFNCPCCGEHCGSVGFESSPYEGPKWKFDGDKTQPTISPSIWIKAYQGNKITHEWHGYLTKGEWITL